MHFGHFRVEDDYQLSSLTSQELLQQIHLILITFRNTIQHLLSTLNCGLNGQRSTAPGGWWHCACFHIMHLSMSSPTSGGGSN